MSTITFDTLPSRYMTGHTTFERLYEARKLHTPENVLKYTRNKDYGSLIGNLLGEGHSRMVFEHVYDDTKIIKIEKEALFGTIEGFVETSGNMYEWMIWNTASDELKEYLAPIQWISNDFVCLIMDKAKVIHEPLEDYDEWLDWKLRVRPILNTIADVKPYNTGWIGDKLVLVDYGFLNLVPTKRIYESYGYFHKDMEIDEQEAWKRLAEWKNEEK